MASLIPGFEYDIFISYRQKDNKQDGWVTEFVNQLKGELEATFKEDISIYFDENPHDGLLETHNVDKSLEGKLRCLIFIPIISRTYCDPKSFAWQHEFCAFNKLAEGDKFGKDIRLSNGNVASRILPVQIHDLDADDKKLIENELDGFIRGIEFIYKELGVNRPLRSNEDLRDNNLNKTYYRNQVNKVALAIKEILSAIKHHEQKPEPVCVELSGSAPIPKRDNRMKILTGSFMALLLVVSGILFIPKLVKTDEQLEKSIAVLPLIDDNQNKENTSFFNGILDEVIINLQRVADIRVPGRTSVEQYRNATKTIPEIAQELGVNYIVEGSGQKYGNKVRLRIQLLEGKKDKHLWGYSYELEIKGIDDMFDIQSRIAQSIAAELKAIVKPEEKRIIEKKPTENLQAYNYYLQGNEFYWQSHSSDALLKASDMYRKAINIDPDFALAYARLSISLSQAFFIGRVNEKLLIESKAAVDSAFRLNPDLPEAHLAMGAFYYHTGLDYSRALDQIELAERQMPNCSNCATLKAVIYRRSGKWELAKEYSVRAFELDPGSAAIANIAGQTFAKVREYPEAEFYFKKAISNNPIFNQPYSGLYNLYLKREGKTNKSREIIEEALKANPEARLNFLFNFKVDLEILDARYDQALTFLSELDGDPSYKATNNYSTALKYATVYKMLNKSVQAYPYFLLAKNLLESEIKRNPGRTYETLFGNLGIAYAGLGQKNKAIEAGKKAVELLPVNNDTFAGTYGIEFLAKVYVMTGEYGAALEQIKFLLSVPSNLSVPLLLLDPVWKPLWGLPGFKEIINTSANAKSN